MSDKIFINETGRAIRVTMNFEVSDATELKLVVMKPGGTIVEWPCTLTDESTMEYIIESGDLDESGTYKAHPYVVLSNWSGYGATIKFKVYPLW